MGGGDERDRVSGSCVFSGTCFLGMCGSFVSSVSGAVPPPLADCVDGSYACPLCRPMGDSFRSGDPADDGWNSSAGRSVPGKKPLGDGAESDFLLGNFFPLFGGIFAFVPRFLCRRNGIIHCLAFVPSIRRAKMPSAPPSANWRSRAM